MLFQDKYFRKAQCLAWHGLESGPFKMLRTKDWLKIKAQDSTFSILVVQDHIESIGKPILLRGDEVLLNGLLAQCA